MNGLDHFAAFAEELAVAARSTALHWADSRWSAEDKNAGGKFDPVTQADRETELAIRALIEARFPDHGIDGEEFGSRPTDGPWHWSLDPIDGTRAFVCGLPSWTILIALLEQGRPVVGAIDVPRLGELYLGYGDVGTLVTAEGRLQLQTSGCRTLSEARLSTTDPYLFSAEELAGYDRVRERVQLTRYGLDGYGYACLASGGIDLVIESGLATHDWNALVPVVTAAGGAVVNWQGGPDLSEGKLVAAATGQLAMEAIQLLSG